MMKRYKFKDFLEETKLPINKVTGIYIDDENRTLFSSYTSKDCDFSKYKDLLHDNEYLFINEDGNYEIDVNSIIEDYKDYYLEVNFPKFDSTKYDMNDQESVDVLQDIYQTSKSEAEFITRITSLDWCVGISLIIIRKDILDKIDGDYKPEINNNIDAYIVNDYYVEDDDNVAYDPLCVIDVNDQQELFDYISKRKNYYTAIVPVSNGEVIPDGTTVYFTDENGNYKIIDEDLNEMGGASLDDDEDDEDERNVS